MAGQLGAMERALGTALGLLTAAAGIVGGAVLVVATANPRGLSAFAGIYVGPVAAALIALVAAGLFEFGLFILRSRNVMDPDGRRGTGIGNMLSLVLFIGSIAYAIVSGILWTAARTANGLVATNDTWAAIAALALYAVMRIAFTIGHVDVGEVARAIGIREAPPRSDAGGSQGRQMARGAVGLLFLLPLVDALIVLVAGAVAPRDRTIYPFATDRTLPAAALWIVGIWALGSLVTGRMSGSVTPRRTRIHTAIVVAALVPALVLDAQIPLYPIIARVAEGNATIATPFGALAPRDASIDIPGPRLIAPPPSAELPQHSRLVGGTAVCVDAPWTFTWARDPAYVRYHLVVRQADATIPLVDTVTSETSFAERGCGWVAGSNRRDWQWQVWGITLDGRTGRGSEIRSFDVAPLR